MSLSYEKKILLRVLQQNPDMGKTAVMKAAFMLQQVKKMDLDYNFSIYTYGPYSAEVTDDVDDLISKQLIVSTMYEYNNSVGYKLNVSNQGKSRAEEVDKQSGEAVAEIVEFIKGKLVKDLELYSTIIYIDSLYTRNSWDKQPNAIIKKVHEIKPHFEESVIDNAMSMLQERGYLAS